MARFVFTMKLPSVKGHMVQEVIGEYQAGSLTEIYNHILKGQKWFLVDQMYTYQERDGRRVWERRGQILLNSDLCGKIKVFVENEADKT